MSNAELGSGAGKVSAIRFASTATITGAYQILAGTNRNCAGGSTPWNTWISCEEVDTGYCGVAFNPAGTRMYFSSQRGTSGSSSGGITYEVSGPFRSRH